MTLLNRCAIGAASVVSLSMPSRVAAQRAVRLAFAPTYTVTAARAFHAPQDTTSHARPSVMNSALCGSLIGAAAGAAAALIRVHTAGPHLDHSEDDLQYAVFVPLGALVGAELGALSVVFRERPE